MKAKLIFMICSVALLAVLLTGCGAKKPDDSPAPTLPNIESEQPDDARSEVSGTPAPTPEPTPEPTPSPTPEPTPEPTLPPLDGTTAAAVGASLPLTVPAGPAVSDAYFSDAVFVGDSRTEGFRLYSGINGARYLCGVSLSVDKVFTDPVIAGATVADALRSESYNKVYIMFGVNELGWPDENVFAEYYGRIIDVIRETHPDATIYVQSILPVSAIKSASSSIYTNANVVRFQKAIVKMCAYKGVHYLNVAEAVQDADGCLPYDATQDGVHLTPAYIKLWADYLRTHTV